MQNTEEEAHEQLSYSFDLGVNTLDTAEIYPVRCSILFLATATLSWLPLLCIYGGVRESFVYILSSDIYVTSTASYAGPALCRYVRRLFIEHCLGLLNAVLIPLVTAVRYEPKLSQKCTSHGTPGLPAETQGRTDRYIGSWLKTRKRDDIVVATKVLRACCQRQAAAVCIQPCRCLQPHFRVRHVSAPAQVAGYGNKYLRPDGETRVTRAHIQAAVDGNLERLGVDHIDLLQARHGCGLLLDLLLCTRAPMHQVVESLQ